MSFLKKYFNPILISLLLVVMFGIMFTTARGDSPIVDEIAHIPAGFSYITRGDYRLNPEHPPLIKDLAAIPLAITGMKFPYEYWEANNPVINNQWETGWRFVFRNGNNPDTVKILAEIPIMLLSLVFGYFVYHWAKELYGQKAGILALILYVFNANIIAHSRFVTTDIGIAFAFFMAMYTLYRYYKNPTPKTLLWAGAAFGLTLLTKFSAPTLLPAYALVFAMSLFRKGKAKDKNLLEKTNSPILKNRFWVGILSFAIIGFFGLLVMYIAYIPHVINMPTEVMKGLITESLPNDALSGVLIKTADIPVLKPLTQYFLGFVMVASHVNGGHDAFLLGQTSNQGWWYYYPVVIAIKTQIGLFILGLVSLLVMKLKKKDFNWFNELLLFALPAALLYMSMNSKMNLGVRHILPIYPFLIIFASKAANMITWENLKTIKNNLINSFIAWIAVLATVWYVLSALFVYPHYLAYYNEFVGGYQNGYKYLTDSNTDWGQDIKRLNQWAEDNNVSQIYVDVFPGGFPAQYYLGDKAIEWHVQNGRPTGYFAVSATFYQNSRLKKDANGGMDYSWLDEMKPIANIGGSILIYDLR